MAIVYYTVAGIALYLVADWILNRLEARRGQRFEYRTLYFFGILLTLALISFEIIRRLTTQTP